MTNNSRPVSIAPFAAILAALCLFTPTNLTHELSAQEEPPPQVDPARIADYDIQVTLDPDNHMLVDAEETLTWVNDSEIPASEMKLHLYMNAFRSPDTRFFEGRGGWTAEDAGYIDVTSIRLADGTDLKTGAVIDESVMTVPLPEPVPYGGKVIMELKFTVKLPHIFLRSGYSEDYYMIGQWFPKVGVYRDGTWICPQYHTNTEFFSNFGRYRVEITVPKNFEVAATGIRQRANTSGEIKTLVYSADQPVHDFAWAASPKFRRSKTDLTYVVDGVSHKLELHLLMQRSRMYLAPVYENAVKKALEMFTSDYGPYPYAKLTVIDPGQGRGQRSGGMEYPMLVTGGSTWLESFNEEAEGAISDVTAHEFGHQYWYAAVATNEFEEAWLDEGLTSYTADKVSDALGSFSRKEPFHQALLMTWNTTHPFRPDFTFSYNRLSPLMTIGQTSSTLAVRRNDYLRLPSQDPITQYAYRQFDNSSYNISAYDKPALALRTLEGVIGRETVREVLREYYTRFRFAHPTGQDFRALVSEVSSRDMSWFFDSVWDGTCTLDYAVTAISGGNEIVVERMCEVALPQTIEITFADGEKATLVWPRNDGTARLWQDGFTALDDHPGVKVRLREGLKGKWLKIGVEAASPVVAAQIDPEYQYVLDTNLANNSYRTKADATLSRNTELNWVRVLGRWLHEMSIYN